MLPIITKYLHEITQMTEWRSCYFVIKRNDGGTKDCFMKCSPLYLYPRHV